MFLIFKLHHFRTGLESNMDIIKIKQEIYESILRGDVSKSVVEKFVKSGEECIAKECELWDFKTTFEETESAYVKILKSIASFHNTYGGYLIFGVNEAEKDTSFIFTGVKKNLLDQKEIRSKFDKYFDKRLDLTYEEININFDSKEILIGLLHIPKREKKSHTLAPIRDGADSRGRVILEKDVVYIRKVDECKKVVSQSDFEFMMSDRHHNNDEAEVRQSRKNIIEHNLPDQNSICPKFIGRLNILQELWSWLSDDFQYTKVLAAVGGKGKTSIAYEFSQLIIRSGTELFDQVIWLTAKKKQFKAAHNQYVETPETHYEDLESLLREVCLRTGFLADEVDNYTLQQLQRSARDGLHVIPSFVVIDDIDSNSIEEQKRIMEVARSISNSTSKVLMTTRANNIYSSDSSILVPGLEGEEYSELVNSLCESMRLQKLNDAKVKKLNLAAEGSPLFTESIMRLFKLGVSLDKAIEEWEGKSGDVVREATLRKEVLELTPEAIKILLTISCVGSLSLSELHQYTDFEYSEITSSIEQLDNLFLISSVEFIQEEPRFESTSSISKLVLSIANEIIPNSEEYINRIKEICAGLEANSQVSIPEVGAAVRQCNSLLKEENYNGSRKTVSALIMKPRYKENSDLYFILAKTDYEDPNVTDDVARKSFSEAFIKGQRKPAFFEMWYQTEKNYGGTSSILDVCKNALNSMGKFDAQWIERCAYANYEQAMGINNYQNKLRYLVACYEQLSRLLRTSNKSKWDKFKVISVKVVDAIWDESIKNAKYEIAGHAVINAVSDGDIRSENFNRMIDISQFFMDEKIVSEKSFKDLLNSLEWAPSLVRGGTINREPLAQKLDQTYNLMKFSTRNKKNTSDT